MQQRRHICHRINARVSVSRDKQQQHVAWRARIALGAYVSRWRSLYHIVRNNNIVNVVYAKRERCLLSRDKTTMVAASRRWRAAMARGNIKTT